MSRVVKVIAIISLCVGVTGVVGGCIGVYGVVQFLATEAERPVDELDMLFITRDLVYNARVRRLEQELATTSEEARRAEIRGELAKLRKEADARALDRRELEEERRYGETLLALGGCIWIVATALLTVAGLLGVRGVHAAGRLLAVSLALTPLAAAITWVITGSPFFLPWVYLLIMILRPMGMGVLAPASVVVAGLSVLAAYAYPAVALVLLYRAKATETGA